MAAAHDLEVETVVDSGPRIAPLDRQFGQRRGDIDPRERGGDIRQRLRRIDRVGAQPLEQFALDGERLIGALRNARGERRQLVGGEPHRGADGLAMAEQCAVVAGLQFVRMLRRHLDEVAQDAVVLDAQAARAAFAAVARLKRRDHPPALVAQAAHLVERRMRAGLDEPAVAREVRRLGGQEMIERIVQAGGFREAGNQMLARFANFAERSFERIVRIGKRVPQCACDLQSVADARQIAGAAAADGNARQGPRQIRRAAKMPANAAAKFGIAREQRDRVLPPRDGARIGQG